MSENCDHNCGSCKENCDSRKPGSFLEDPHADTHVKKIIGVVSGKGGVGKSLVTALSAVSAHRQGKKTAILDADITGPSIPKMFGIHEKAMMAGDDGILPVKSAEGIKLMSLNLLMEDESDPVIWRGPIIAGTVKQFWTDVLWGDIDVMLIDMPPGTGDVPLTVFQSIPVDGIVVVTSPQDLVSMIVEKAIRMAKRMQIPVLGVIENMSYIKCPDCGNRISLFGESHIEEIAAKNDIPVLGKIPVEPTLAGACDGGNIEQFESDWLSEVQFPV